ncbi:helix-turn-helix domain-containing protein [Streptomyces sp. NPDC059649]|uniref:helix-turn-helix domain-containing protein n=1 Tax=Streptomyces sp. NPDC059649 TaxID=3346895 RepID=UPI0036CA1B80
MPARSPFTVVWDTEQREMLRQLARSRTAPLRRILRARAALAAAGGLPTAAIARDPGVHVATVRRWRKRFHHEGIAALEDRSRPGRPRRYGPEVHLAVVATVTSAKPSTDSQWTHKSVANSLEHYGISAPQVGRILASPDLKPHLVRGWLTRPDDPDFHKKAAEVCALHLHRPARSIVLSIDEKTAIQARSRRPPPVPHGPAMSNAVSSNTVATARPRSSPPWTCTPARSSSKTSPATTPRPSSASSASWTRPLMPA